MKLLLASEVKSASEMQSRRMQTAYTIVSELLFSLLNIAHTCTQQ